MTERKRVDYIDQKPLKQVDLGTGNSLVDAAQLYGELFRAATEVSGQVLLTARRKAVTIWQAPATHRVNGNGVQTTD